MVSSMLSLAAARRISAAISTSMTTVCLTRRSQSQMPTMHSMLSGLRKIVSMKRLAVGGWRLVGGAAERVERPARGRTDAKVVVLACGQPTVAGVGDHGGIVGAKLGARIQNL